MQPLKKNVKKSIKKIDKSRNLSKNLKIKKNLQNCIGPTIRIGRESWCLPYAGFFYFLIEVDYIRYIVRSKPDRGGRLNTTERSDKAGLYGEGQQGRGGDKYERGRERVGEINVTTQRDNISLFVKKRLCQNMLWRKHLEAPKIRECFYQFVFPSLSELSVPCPCHLCCWTLKIILTVVTRPGGPLFSSSQTKQQIS